MAVRRFKEQNAYDGEEVLRTRTPTAHMTLRRFKEQEGRFIPTVAMTIRRF